MSRKERERMTVMAGVAEKRLTLVQGAGLMGVSDRHSQRIQKRYEAEGEAGLVHRLRGKPSARRKPTELRVRALALYAEERYADFGPTLMAEQLARIRLGVDHATLRRWRMVEGASATGVSGPVPEVEAPAGWGGEEAGAGAAGPESDEAGREGSASGEPSVAARGRGRGASVLERGPGGWSRGATGGAGLRSASAPRRPPCGPHRQSGRRSNGTQTTKGTFSRGLNRGHF